MQWVQDVTRAAIWHTAVIEPDADTLAILAGPGRMGARAVAAAKPWTCARMQGDASAEKALLHEVSRGFARCDCIGAWRSCVFSFETCNICRVPCCEQQ